ncbi:TPA: acylneuraminate cytidylyltransferase family protein, partial [Enterococcus faecium]|nr:acylneuraminate cytidylyltransferase family protein [Enterococcus faecium]
NLEELIDEHLKNLDKDVYFSVVSARRNPYFNMVKRIENEVTIVNKSRYTSRQQTPEVFEMNASMYSFKPEFLKKSNYIFDG